MELINKELESATYTYDYKGNVLVQNRVNMEYIPAEFKFKYKVKKTGKQDDDQKKSSKALYY